MDLVVFLILARVYIKLYPPIFQCSTNWLLYTEIKFEENYGKQDSKNKIRKEKGKKKEIETTYRTYMHIENLTLIKFYAIDRGSYKR